jgi:hypothetical protein
MLQSRLLCAGLRQPRRLTACHGVSRPLTASHGVSGLSRPLAASRDLSRPLTTSHGLSRRLRPFTTSRGVSRRLATSHDLSRPLTASHGLSRSLSATLACPTPRNTTLLVAPLPPYSRMLCVATCHASSAVLTALAAGIVCEIYSWRFSNVSLHSLPVTTVICPYASNKEC